MFGRSTAAASRSCRSASHERGRRAGWPPASTPRQVQGLHSQAHIGRTSAVLAAAQFAEEHQRDIQVGRLGLTLSTLLPSYAVRDSTSARDASARLIGSRLRGGMASGKVNPRGRANRSRRGPIAPGALDRLGGEGLNVEAYNPASRHGHLKDDDADEGIGLFQVHPMGWRLSPGWDPDSPRKSLRTASARSSSTHELTLPRVSDRNRTSDQMVGGSNPSGRANVLSRDIRYT